MNHRLNTCLILLLCFGLIGCATDSCYQNKRDAKMFVRSNLGIDLNRNSFGSPLENYSHAQKTEHYPRLPLEADLDWYKIDPTNARAINPQLHSLEYGFNAGKLEAISIWLVTSMSSTNSTAREEAQASLNSTLSEFRNLSGGRLTYHGRDLWMHYDGLCSPQENIAARILIRPPQ